MRNSILALGGFLLAVGLGLYWASVYGPLTAYVGGPIPPCIPNVNCPVSTTSSVSSGTTTYYYTTTNPYAGCIGPQSTNPTCTAASLQTQTSSTFVTSSGSTSTLSSTTITTGGGLGSGSPTSMLTSLSVFLSIAGFIGIGIGAVVPGKKMGGFG